jgi:Lauroyl/myristoyl acyltransferase
LAPCSAGSVTASSARADAVALRNLELCFPELSAGERERLAKEHFRWLGAASSSGGCSGMRRRPGCGA